MNKKTIYLSEEIDKEWAEYLYQHYNVVDNFENCNEIEGIITRKIAITRQIIKNCPKLKIISDHGTGTDQIDLRAAKEFNVKVTNTPGLNAQSVAELILAFMLGLSYKIKYNNQGMQEGLFNKFGLAELNGSELYGKKVGVIGSGYIAQRLSCIVKNAFDCTVYCYNPNRDRAYLEKLGLIKVDDLKELFKTMDFISVNVPLTETTLNMINCDILNIANPDLILVNTSRGGIVNEDDLYKALVNKKIRGAALDVFTNEPPSKDNPLLSLSNFMGTLHTGGSSYESLKRVGEATVKNLVEGLGDSFC